MVSIPLSEIDKLADELHLKAICELDGLNQKYPKDVDEDMEEIEDEGE